MITQIDAKTKLQEFSLKKFKRLPIYKIISNTGPRHKPVFRVAVKLQNTKFYNGEGKSKKEADVTLKSGSSHKIDPASAKQIIKTFDSLNSSKQKKVRKDMNKDTKGFMTIMDFAQENVQR